MTSQRYAPIANETKQRRAARCESVARRQASKSNTQRLFTPGEQVFCHTFDSYVGGNPTGLYVNLKCGKCGSVDAYQRTGLSSLKTQKGFCRRCSPNRRNKP
jgi:hypothetical protein